MRPILIVLLLATPAFSQEFFAVGEGLCWRPDSSDFQNQFDPSLSMDHDWDAGFRAGVGVKHPWGWKASWTYTNFGVDDLRTWTDVTIPGDVYTSYGDLDYQSHDFEVGRLFAVTQACELEVFGGFRWGQIDYTLRDTRGGTARNNWRVVDSKTDSYGLRLGGKGRIYLPAGLNIFGQGAVSGLYSTTDNWGSFPIMGSAWDVTDNHENHAVDAAAGIAWQCNLLEVAAGYEWNFWADAIQRRSSASQPDYHDLLLEGVFLRATARY